MKLWTYKGDQLWAEVIEHWTCSPYAHTELEVSPGVFLSSTLETGPRFAQFNELTSQNVEDWRVDDLQTTESEDSTVLRMANLLVGAQAIYGEHPSYSKEGIALNFLPQPIIRQNPTQMFCSQTVVLALQPIGLFLNMVACMMSPNDVVEWIDRYFTSWRTAT